MQMKKQLRYALMAVLLAGLLGCGLKGPLYFPPNDKPAAQPTTNADNLGKNQPQPAGTQQ
ncbi:MULTISPECIES: lipoprotein [unclassified Serratia (in: enterobacteria)]|uniref:LPS translocon maturation chaperone LptM n=1 Tax=unclassified Serratia (in: enterobacteria) TaxID=2647522 RepID=UPI0005028055|nr:lipoprotein [Serratia sp. Ag2]KFK98984.1 lipoprotein [Serratia sp. Ag1]